MQITPPFFAPYRQKKEDFFMSEKKVGKRLLTWVLVLVMTLSLLPLNVLAAENDTPENTNPSIERSEETLGAYLVKSATKDGDTYKIQLESWVTGKAEQTTGSAPLDIVLVLDQSGSMEGDKLDSLKKAVSGFVDTINEDAAAHDVVHRIAIVGFASNGDDSSDNDGKWKNTGLFVNGEFKKYITYTSSGYDEVYDPDKDKTYYVMQSDLFGDYAVEVSYDSEQNSWGYLEDYLIYEEWVKVTPKQDANDTDESHTQFYEWREGGSQGLTDQDYQDALVSSGEASIKTAISKLSASGATRASYGMEMANNVFANNELRKGSSRVVVFFTDGEPGRNGYNHNEAGRAIAQAHTTKNNPYNAKVFSVGMFDKGPSTKVKNFMNHVSSNYPDANASEKWGSWKVTPGDKADTKYYMTVENDNLSDVFETISGSILNPNVAADASTVLTDKLSQYFDFDGVSVDENGTVTGVTVKKVAYDGNGKWASDGKDITEEVTVGLNGKTVTVKGFDYSDEKNVVTDTPSGYKLVVTFNVKPDTNCKNWTGSKPYETNNDKATLANDGEKPFATVASPKAFVDTYKVEYRFDETAPNGVNPPVDSRYYISGQQATVEQPEESSVNEGGNTYTFEGWKNGEANVGEKIDISGNVTLTGTWSKTANTASYTVNYLWNGEPIPGATSAQKTAEYGTEVTEFPIEIEGYTPVKESETITIDADNSKNVINLNYYKNVTLTANSDTVTYDGQPHNGSPYSYEALGLLPDHTVESVDYTCEPQTNVGEYDIELDNAKIVDADGNDVTNLYQITYNYGTLIIEPCDVTVTIKGNTSTVTYDGAEQEVTGYTVESSDKRYTVSDFTFSGTAVAKGTNAGTYPMNLTANQFKNTNTNFTNVEFVVTDGKLTINPVTDKVTVTIKGNTGSETYNGEEQSVTGYTVESISNNLYTSSDFSLKAGVVAEAKGTDANTTAYLMNLTSDSFANKSQNFSNVKFDVTDGSLTITKRNIVVTANDVTVPYDGKAHGGNGCTADNLVEGHNVTATITGSETNVGVYPDTLVPSNAKITDQSGTDVTNNYKVEYARGTLTITKRTETATVTITGNHNSVKYNGREQSVTGFTYTAPEGVTVTLNAGSKAEAKGTDKGTYYMGLTKDDFTVFSEIYKEVKIIVNDGYLEITRSGGHHPRPKPTVEIEDDDALGLNTTDHFAYIVGYGNGEVRPQNNITRAEVATIFFRLLTDDVRDENLTKTNRYSDVAATSWYNTAVSTLSSMGIITGYPDGTFRPNAAITRAEFAAIAARFDNDGDKTAAKFSDIASHWAKDEISIAYNNGWITGYPDGTFGPQRDITRAETMTLVNRVLNRQPETEDDLLPNMTVWTDNANPNAWYYLAVQEATNSHYYKFKTNSQYEKWTELRETRDWTQLEK